MLNQKYGVVYTPDSLSDFVADLLYRFSDKKHSDELSILDPASGECSLLKAAKKYFNGTCTYTGIDIDSEATNRTKDEFQVIHNDAILPQNVKTDVATYWRKKLQPVDIVIANPPWSSEKVYNRTDLSNAGYSLMSGQYDSYVLFIELSYKVLRDGGLMGFIIPDSLFDAQNVNLRKFLTKNTQIKVIARLGEKIFDEVNRATTVIVCKKEIPTEESLTECFRLSTDDRKKYLSGKKSLIDCYFRSIHVVKQKRFLSNCDYHFDIDTRANEEKLIKKICSKTIKWDEVFIFGRGVEISKTGKIVYCSHCGKAQGYSKKHFLQGRKDCIYCKEEVLVNEMTIKNAITANATLGGVPILVGESIQRYGIHSNNYIIPNIKGINYKTPDLYAPPKLMVRKTGLGIYAAVDYSGKYTSQTVYIMRSIKDNVQLEYYLALLNSRVVYYFYLKIYGENEWKSHPYLTKQIIFSLPIRPYVGDDVDKQIVAIAQKIMKHYNHESDLELEKLIMKKYGLNKKEQGLVIAEMNRLPDLSAIKNMKMEA